MMSSIDSGSSSNLSRKSEQICWWTSFWSEVKFFETNFTQIFFIFNSRKNIFWRFLYRCLQSQQLFKCSYDDFRAQFHWFWPLFPGLKQRQVDRDVGHLRCSLDIQKTVYTSRKHAQEIGNSHHRSLSTTCNSTQSKFFFNLTKNFRLIRCSCFSSHIVIGTRKKKTFVSSLYRKNTITATNTCFRSGIADTHSYPTLHSFPPYSSRTSSARAISLFNSQTL